MTVRDHAKVADIALARRDAGIESMRAHPAEGIR